MNIKQAEFRGSFGDVASLPDTQLPEVALVGRSNVGKSSLINKLANRRKLAITSSTPGKTRTINFYLLNNEWFLVDLPGYGYARVSRDEQRRWRYMLEGYLLGRSQLRGVIHVVDIRHEPGENDKLMAGWLSHYRIPSIVVATKADKVSRGRRPQHLARVREGLNLREPVICFSAVTGEGLKELCAAIAKMKQEP